MNEKVILVNSKDEEIGSEEKIRAHILGKMHRAFSVFVFNQKGEILLQERNKNKYHSGGLWTNTCCSHPRPNEKTEDAAKRRLFEEMGFSCDLKEIFSFTYRKEFDNGIVENEFDHIFIGDYAGEIRLNSEEAESYRWSNVDEVLVDLNRRPEIYTYWFKIAFPIVSKQMCF